MKIEEFIKRFNLIIVLVILFFGLISARNIYEGKKIEIASLRKEIRQLEEKEAILKDIQILEKEIKEYKEKFKKFDVSILIEELTGCAGICDVKVSSIRPEPERISENFIWQPIIMEVSSSYHNLGRLISTLEKNPQIKIEEIGLSRIEVRKKTKDLRTRILISLIYLK